MKTSSKKPIKVLFLDFDGVIINRKSLMRASGLKADADVHCVAALNRVLDKTGAHVVISSTWRMLGLLPCKDLLHKWGVKAKVIGSTPRGHSSPRGDEISQWLQEHAGRFDVESIAIVDDGADMGNLYPYLVRTKFESGLTEDDADALIAMLDKSFSAKPLRRGSKFDLLRSIFPGQKFGNLSAMYRAPNDKAGRICFNCLCDCGNRCEVRIGDLASGHTKSCGCLRAKSIARRLGIKSCKKA